MPPPRDRALFFRGARQVLTLARGGVPRRGGELGELAIVREGGVLVAGGRIVRAGPSGALEAEARRLQAAEIDCRGSVILPGFVDSHTHLVFAGSRVDDFERRIRGESYGEIAKAGGGIASTARRVANASIDDLVHQASRFLKQFAAHGTTTVEVKSGYGLDVRNELKILEAVGRLRRAAPVELVPTLLAAHVLPEKFRKKRKEYLDVLIRRLIPEVAARRLAKFVDCYCDHGAFTLAECRAVLEAGRRFGLAPRLHAEQMARTGAARLAVEAGAASADHLDHASSRDIRALAGSNVVATLLPASNFFLASRNWPPARRLIDSGAAVALATDFNPGTSPTLDMQLVLTIAATQMRMTPAECISAATLNAAYSLGCAGRLGSLEPGKEADLAVMEAEDYRELACYFGWNRCRLTVKGGRVVYFRKQD